MKNYLKTGIAVFILSTSFQLNAQVKTLDDFENESKWIFIRSDGVNLKLETDAGHTGKALRFDYDFTNGTGYGGIQKKISVDLPDNYQFSFWIKASSPSNNFEIKFIDSTGNNVWWVNNRNYTFPEDWKKIRIKKRHISFAWGPTSDQNLKKIDRIEFTVASFVGGKGTIWLDDLKFEPLPAEQLNYPQPEITTSSALKNAKAAFISDNNKNTYWQSKNKTNEYVLIDFIKRRDFGGLNIAWAKEHFAEAFTVMTSADAKQWEQVYAVASNHSNTSFISLPEAEARYVKINLLKNHNNNPFGIAEIRILDVKNSLTTNDFIIYSAKNSPPGNYPRYFNEEASYWTISGVNCDTKEALISEDGMVEVDKALFSLEPMIKTADSLYNWSNVKSIQFSGNNTQSTDFSFVPAVMWNINHLQFTCSITSTGEANRNSLLNIKYCFENQSGKKIDFEFYVIIRPFQVNPYYQFLNMTGGAGKIFTISEQKNKTIAVDNKTIIPVKQYDSFRAISFDEGNPVDFIRNGVVPENTTATDKNGLASGIMKFIISLQPKEKTDFFIVVPFHEKNIDIGKINHDFIGSEIAETNQFWKDKVGQISFNLPPSADKIIDTYKSNLIYILINRDKAGIQPGSRSYERSWIRDGSLTSSALLKSGIIKEVEEFINWYSGHLFENGKVPCVVDFRGPDPVPENDSHGQFIYLVREYYNFTHDTAFLLSKNEKVLKVVDYIEWLIEQRSTDYYKNGNDSIRSLYGLVPESISHEGYSAKPMHSYWDDFFTLKGLKDAAEIQKILNNTSQYQRITKIRDTFRANLYESINLTIKRTKIDYIPGCAELGDFDATSTTVALTPCNELNNLPKPQVYNTFDKYFNYFINRRDRKIDWLNYTPYENRLIGSFIFLDEPEKAHQLIDFFLKDQRPQGWHHWAEVVWRDYRTPRYIGDMPHTWVGSDFINAIRSMFVYENEYDQTIVVGSALYQDWIDNPNGMSVENMPTYYGNFSYSVKKQDKTYQFKIYGNLNLPAGGIRIKNFNGAKMPVSVIINGNKSKDFNNKEIIIKEFPADIMIEY